MELEFTAFAKFTETCAQADKIWPCNGYTQAHGRLGYVVNTILVQSKAIRLIGAINEVDKVLALRTGTKSH